MSKEPEGTNSNSTIELDDDIVEWMVAKGYAYKDGSYGDEVSYTMTERGNNFLRVAAKNLLEKQKEGK